MRREVWAISAVIAACLVAAAGIMLNDPLRPAPGAGEEQEPTYMSGILAEAIGPPNLTTYGLLVIPVNVTNNMDKGIDFRSMNFTLRLADGSEMAALCNGPRSVAPMAVEQFLIIVSSDRMLNITAVHVENGREYLNFQVPPVSKAPDGNGGTVKDRPSVRTSLRPELPFGPRPSEPYLATYGVPAEGALDTWVEERADDTRIGIMVYVVGLSNEEVYINASFGGGEPQWTNLYNDGKNGCFGMFITDQANIEGDKGWTWMYVSSDGPAYYNITLSVTTYALGTHEVRFYAYDQDTGERISATEITNYTVLGTDGRPDGVNHMFDSIADPREAAYVPGGIYHFNLTDTCRFAQYGGVVRSKLTFPYAANVWTVNGDGTETELAKGGDGTYDHAWVCEHGAVPHTIHVKVRIEAAGTPESDHRPAVAFYQLVDERTGQPMSQAGSDGRPAARIDLWPA